jgi:hypothetical protein
MTYSSSQSSLNLFPNTNTNFFVREEERSQKTEKGRVAENRKQKKGRRKRKGRVAENRKGREMEMDNYEPVYLLIMYNTST